MSMTNPRSSLLGAALLAAAVLVTVPADAHAQGFGDRLKKRAKEAAERATENRVDKKATEATDAALDKAENSVKCAASDKKCLEKAKRDGKTVVTDDGASGGSSSGGSSASGARRAGGKVNAGSDFTPGTRVLYATDFKRDEIGDFPRSFRLKKGNFEVADVDGVRYLRGTSPGEIEVPLPETLPSMFTIEFDWESKIGWRQSLFFVPQAQQESFKRVEWDIYSAGVEGTDYDVSARYKDGPEQMHHIQIMADGEYVKVYVDGVRTANAPNADVGRSRALRFNLQGTDDQPVLFGNLRIAAGGKDLYKALGESGRVTAEGIFFDTNSDHIRPESEPALNEIGDMLGQHADLRLAIEGHTDNVGGAAKNQALSEKRAAAVRQWLMTNKGIAASRLEAHGYGATKPAGDNATEAGRQKNRRVELVKL